MRRSILLLLSCVILLDALAVQSRPPNDDKDDNKSQLEDVPKEQDDEVSTDHSGECIICYEGFEARTGLELKCGHKFHKSCLAGWFGTQRLLAKSCPMCRQDIQMADGQPFATFVDHNFQLFRRRLRASWGLMAGLEQPLHWDAPGN